jgi:FixJ family two-component response regulator
MRHSHESLFRALGHDIGTYDSLDSFLRQFPGGAGCLCIDAQEPAVPAAACLRVLRRHRFLLPVVVLADHLPAAYHVALDGLYAPLLVLGKPVSGRRLLEAADALWRASGQPE